MSILLGVVNLSEEPIITILMVRNKYVRFLVFVIFYDITVDDIITSNKYDDIGGAGGYVNGIIPLFNFSKRRNLVNRTYETL